MATAELVREIKRERREQSLVGLLDYLETTVRITPWGQNACRVPLPMDRLAQTFNLSTSFFKEVVEENPIFGNAVCGNSAIVILEEGEIQHRQDYEYLANLLSSKPEAGVLPPESLLREVPQLSGTMLLRFSSEEMTERLEQIAIFYLLAHWLCLKDRRDLPDPIGVLGPHTQ